MPDHGGSARIIDGAAIAAGIRRRVARQTEILAARHGIVPGLTVVLVGNNPASEIYVRTKLKHAAEAGIRSRDIRLPADITQAGLLDHIGAFAVTSGIGLKELCDGFKAKNDDYNAIMAEAIADRLAEAFAECLHKRVRCEWGYGCAEGLSNADLIQEKYRGIRPAAGYPACPDHTEKGPLWRLLDVKARTGMLITESFAMWPGSSVSGLYFAHPQSRYFSLGKIDRDQVADYSERKKMSVKEIERWLGQNLNYDPAE